MIRQIFSFHILLFYVLPWHVKHSHGETVSGCTINNNQRRTNNDKTSVTLSCANNGFILVRNLTFGVHKSSLLTSTAPTCAYQPGDCTTRTTFIGMECNGLTSCNLDLNPQYLHICKWACENNSSLWLSFGQRGWLAEQKAYLVIRNAIWPIFAWPVQKRWMFDLSFWTSLPLVND